MTNILEDEKDKLYNIIVATHRIYLQYQVEYPENIKNLTLQMNLNSDNTTVINLDFNFLEDICVTVIYKGPICKYKYFLLPVNFIYSKDKNDFEIFKYISISKLIKFYKFIYFQIL